MAVPATTPNLSFSPSSTESSGGDSTIQMSNYLDEPFSLSGISGSKVWPWLDGVNFVSEVSPSLKGLESLPSNTSPVVNCSSIASMSDVKMQPNTSQPGCADARAWSLGACISQLWDWTFLSMGRGRARCGWQFMLPPHTGRRQP